MNKFFQFNEYFELAQLFNDCTAYQISIEYLDKAIELSTYLPINKNRLLNAYALRGNSKILLSNYREGISDYSKAIEIEPLDSELFFWRGFAYEVLKDYEKAFKDIKVSLYLDPTFELAKNLFSDLKKKL